MSDVFDPTEELKALEKKRATLQQAMRIARAVERLNYGLQAVVLLGKPTASIPKHVLAQIEELDDKTKTLSSTRLKEILARLEASIEADLDLVMRLADMSDDQLLNVGEDVLPAGKTVESLLREYAKNSQTAVALKVLLRARGEVTRPSSFVAAKESLFEKIAELNEREQHCRKKVRTNIVSLMNDTDRLIQTPGMPDAMKGMLQTTRNGLAMNLAHVDAGKSISEMPIPIESVEVSSEEVSFLDTSAEEMEKTQRSPVAPPPVIPPRPAPIPQQPAKQPGLLNKMKRWLVTPTDVTWEDIKKGRDK